ncbi:tetratricopeptide repeat protein [Morganella morganii]|uniref:Sel1 repeat family protein n=2 Tax=Bacteria TaxID=2 RepID=A0AAU6TZB2_UNCXX|nr:sel1 repeat family protein [Morganella morganii subsp. morganii]
MIWFQKAAEQNHASAQFNLGMMYQNGDGVEKNEKVAQEWFQKAEQQKTK